VHGAFIRALLDALVLLFAVSALIVAVATFQKVEQAVVYVEPYDQTHWQQSVSVEEFYTLTTCYLTYYKKVRPMGLQPVLLELRPTRRLVQKFENVNANF
jgi:hypothetical protein